MAKKKTSGFAGPDSRYRGCREIAMQTARSRCGVAVIAIPGDVALQRPHGTLDRHTRSSPPPTARCEGTMIMKRLVVLGIVAVLFASSASGQDSKKPATPESLKAEKETRYLAFQIFTYGPDPKIATYGRGEEPNRQVPGQGGASRLHRGHQTADRHRGRPADPTGRHAGARSALIMATPRSPGSSSLRLNLALETDVAVGFHIDDSMFWARRKDLWSDPNNVEALDWDGTPCTGRRLDWQTGPEQSRMPRHRRCVSTAR